MNDAELRKLWADAKDAIKCYLPDESAHALTISLLSAAEAGHVNARAIVDREIEAFTGCACGDDELCGDEDGSAEREQAVVRGALTRLRAAMGDS